MLGRARLSAVLLGVAGVVLFASLFMPWYSAKGVLGRFLVLFGAVDRLTTLSAWRAFSVADIALVCVAVYLVVLAAVIARGWHPSPVLALLLGVPTIAALALVVVKIADPPHVSRAIIPARASRPVAGSLSMDVKYGVVVALAALVLATVGWLVASLHRPASPA